MDSRVATIFSINFNSGMFFRKKVMAISKKSLKLVRNSAEPEQSTSLEFPWLETFFWKLTILLLEEQGNKLFYMGNVYVSCC